MTISFFEPDAIPQPKDKVKIEYLAAGVQPDRWRIKIEIHVTPFQVRPNLAVALLRDSGEGDNPLVVGDMTIIETMHNKMEFMLHIRGLPDPHGHYRLKTRLFYEQGVHHPTDEREVAVYVPTLDELPPPSMEENGDA
jgi:hypothetical protein